MRTRTLMVGCVAGEGHIDADFPSVQAVARSEINCFLCDYFRGCKPAIFAEFQESISEGFFVWATECWLLQLQGRRRRQLLRAQPALRFQ
jgi:hypothetical protein